MEKKFDIPRLAGLGLSLQEDLFDTICDVQMRMK